MNLRWLVSLVVILVLAIAAAVVGLVTTERGAVWLAGEIDRLSGGTVRLVGVSGTIITGLQADALAIDAGGATITATGAALSLQPASLLRRRVEILSLTARRVRIVTRERSAAAGQAFRMPTISLPVVVVLGESRVEILEIVTPGSARLITGLSFAGELHRSVLTLRELRAVIGDLQLTIAGTADLIPALPVTADVSWRLSAPALSGSGTVRGELSAFSVEQVVQTPDRVVLSGTIRDLATAPHLTLVASWDAFTRELAGLGSVTATSGRIRAEGSPQSWAATIDTRLSGDALPEMTAKAIARGEGQRVMFDEFDLRGLFGAVRGRGTVDITDGTRVLLEAVASRVNPAAFRAGLDGRLSANIRVDARIPGETEIRIADLRGTLMGRPVAGSGFIAASDRAVTFRDLNLRAGRNRLRADATVGDRLAGHLDLAAPELNVLWPGLRGSLVAQANLAGTRAQPVLDANMRGTGFALGASVLGEFTASARIDRQERVTMELQARELTVANKSLGNLDASLEGSLSAHRLSVSLAGGVVNVALHSSGAWDGKALRHEMSDARIAADTIGEWQLSGNPDLVLASGSLRIGDHCWTQGDASLCLHEGAWSPGAARLVAELRQLSLDRFNRWLSSDLRITGMANADLDLKQEPEGLHAQLSWRQEGTTLIYTGGDEPLVTPLSVAELSANVTPALADFKFEMRGESGVQLAAAGRISAPFDDTASLDGRLSGELPDISPLLPLLAADVDLADLAGRITLDAALAGSADAPRINGALRLSQGALALPDLGIKLEAIELAVRGDDSAVLTLKGTARAGGPLTLDGEFQPLAEEGSSAWLRIRGDKVDAVRIPDRYVQASPDITLRYETGRLSVDGGVVIPKADIVIRALPATAASPSPDAVVMDGPVAGEPNGAGLVVGGELNLSLGQDVHLQGFGLDTRLTGSLKLSQGPEGYAAGNGVLRLMEGKFGAYGRELVIERGTLAFAGPLDDPTLDIRASRRIDYQGQSVTAGLLLSGTAQQPQSRVFSDPSMSEADALSYLISGRPMSGATDADRSAIAGAALSLGVHQMSPLTQQLGNVVTLDELGLEGGSTLDETELVAGKQLSPDLYVRFAYGLFSRVGSILARYRLGRGVSIEASTGEDQALDLVYSVEKK